jgi:L-aminopeptidase/D-esterase-like protein
METMGITDIRGFKIGHAQDLHAATGCTVILCENGAVAGVDIRGGSPGTRETDALNPVCNRKEIHAVLLSGGSAFGLDAAGGVMRFLEERGVGRDVGVTFVPNVCAAILFDLNCGNSRIRPDAEMGYAACRNAGSTPLAEGNVGAGTGATVGKILGPGYAMKGGIGAFALRQGALEVGAVFAVNCVGDIFDTRDNRYIAGVLNRNTGQVGGTEEIILSRYGDQTDFFSGNTVIGCIFTNARLDKAQANKLASLGQNGIARTVRPAHSTYDGDTVFTMCSGMAETRFDAVGIMAVKATEQAILRAVKRATSLCGYPAYNELNNADPSEEAIN